MNRDRLLLTENRQVQSTFQSKLSIPLLCAWLLLLLTFSAPGREGPASLGGLDMLAFAKLGIRLLSLTVFSILIIRSWQYPHRSAIIKFFLPLIVYVSWAFLSTLWSPLPSVSLGQSGGLLAQLMLAFLIALHCSDSREVSRVLFHLTMGLLTFNGILLVIYFISPDLSGLSRGSSAIHDSGLVHPTAAGATASLGLLSILAVRLLWGYRWSKWLLYPCTVIHLLILIAAYSRTAIAVGMFTVILVFIFFSKRHVLALTIILLCCATVSYIAIDPHLDSTRVALEQVVEITTRGESTSQLNSFNGRTLLWDEIKNSIKDSPIIGQGYFVTSATGEIDVWGDLGNFTAHNVILQVLVSTGAIGLFFFIWGMVKPLSVCFLALMRNEEERKMGAFMVVMAIWYFGWGLLSSSFMGPIRGESVAFFLLLGVAIGNLVPERQAEVF